MTMGPLHPKAVILSGVADYQGRVVRSKYKLAIRPASDGQRDAHRLLPELVRTWLS